MLSAHLNNNNNSSTTANKYELSTTSRAITPARVAWHDNSVLLSNNHNNTEQPYSPGARSSSNGSVTNVKLTKWRMMANWNHWKQILHFSIDDLTIKHWNVLAAVLLMLIDCVQVIVLLLTSSDMDPMLHRKQDYVTPTRPDTRTNVGANDYASLYIMVLFLRLLVVLYVAQLLGQLITIYAVYSRSPGQTIFDIYVSRILLLLSICELGAFLFIYWLSDVVALLWRVFVLNILFTTLIVKQKCAKHMEDSLVKQLGSDEENGTTPRLPPLKPLPPIRTQKRY